MSNEALVNFLFRSKFDSSTLLKETLVEEIQTYVDNTDDSILYKMENVNLHSYIIDSTIQNFNKIHQEKEKEVKELKSKIEIRIGELTDKIQNSRSLLSIALLSEKKLTGESYTSILPLEEEYSSKASTATIKDGMVIGVQNGELKGEDYILVKGINIVGEEYTTLHTSSTSFPYTLKMENKIKSYNQIRVEVPQVVRSGVIHIKFKTPQVISVLSQKNFEIMSKTVVSEISIPVDATTKSLKIRFHSKRKQEVVLDSCSYTDKVYTASNIFYESEAIRVDEKFSYVSIETCDNYTDPNVDLDYYIRLNSGNYERFRPSGRYKVDQSDKLIQSVISIDKYSDNGIIKLEDPVLEDNVYKFYPQDLEIIGSKCRGFGVKFGEDLYTMKDYYRDVYTKYYEFYTFNKEGFNFYIAKGQSIIINGELFTNQDGKDGEIKVEKGINHFKVLNTYWNEVINLKKSYIKSIHSTHLIVVDRETGKERRVENIYSKDYDFTNSYYLQLLESEVDIFIEETVLQKRLDSERLIEYFYKNTIKPIYLASYITKKQVDTIQIRVNMKSKDKRTCPYISKIYIKGI